MSRYPYLLFDADNTLFDFSAAERFAFRRTCEENGLTWSEENYEVYRRINAALWADFDRGLRRKEELVVDRFRLYFAELGIVGDAPACQRTQEHSLGLCADLLPKAEELCRRLAATHRLYLVTNGMASVQRSRLARASITPYLAGVFISEEAGHAKPEVAYFDHVFAQIPGITRENCLLIGDSLTSDIQGANNYGIPCVWFDPAGAPLPQGYHVDHIIRELNELYAILGD